MTQKHSTDCRRTLTQVRRLTARIDRRRRYSNPRKTRRPFARDTANPREHLPVLQGIRFPVRILPDELF